MSHAARRGFADEHRTADLAHVLRAQNRAPNVWRTTSAGGRRSVRPGSLVSRTPSGHYAPRNSVPGAVAEVHEPGVVQDDVAAVPLCRV